MTTRTFKNAVLTALCTAGLTACSPNKPSAMDASYNLAAIRAAAEAGADIVINGETVSPKEAAEELALAAEQLAQSANFAYAGRLTSEALKIDSANVRAKFWSATVGPIMQLKGFATRIEPLAKQNAIRYRSYVQAKKDLKAKVPFKAVTDFAFNGPKDIASEADVQEIISRVTLKLDELRKTLKSLRGEQLTIYKTRDSVAQSDLDNAAMACYAKEETQDQITLVNCDLSKAFEVKMNAADFEAAQTAVAGVQVYIGVLNSYDLTGVLTETEKSQHNDLSFEQLLRNPSFGKLRDGRTLALLPELAADASLAIRSALVLQADLCGSKTEGTWSREGYAIPSGDCGRPQDGVEAALQTLSALSLSAAPVTYFNQGQTKSIKVDLVQFSKKPLSDLRAVQPLETNRFGQVTKIQDPSVGGLFPNADLNEVLANGAL